jgi:hypothetical protein
MVFQPSASLSRIHEQPAGELVPKAVWASNSSVKETSAISAGGQFVARRNLVGGAKRVPLHPVVAKSSLSPPTAHHRNRCLLRLARVQHRKQRRVHEHGLGIAYQSGTTARFKGSKWP